MRRIDTYKNLTIWKESVSLIKEVYRKADTLPKSEEFNLKLQLKKAVVSVALNIAEGKNRKTSRAFSHFLSISAGSLAETDAILEISQELGFIEYPEDLKEKTDKLIRQINSLRSKIS